MVAYVAIPNERFHAPGGAVVFLGLPFELGQGNIAVQYIFGRELDGRRARNRENPEGGIAIVTNDGTQVNLPTPSPGKFNVF
jgi:hypothetical protein